MNIDRHTYIGKNIILVGDVHMAVSDTLVSVLKFLGLIKINVTLPQHCQHMVDYENRNMDAQRNKEAYGFKQPKRMWT